MASGNFILKTGSRGYGFELQRAFADLAASARQANLAWALARHDIAARYRGSILGPFWITLSMGAMILGIGFLYSQLFKMDLHEFLPFVALGIVTWGFISATIIESCEAFVQATSILRQTALPMFTFIWRTVLRNLITLAHHVVIVAAVLVWAGKPMSHALMSVAGILMAAAILSWVSMIAAIASARFRDIPQIIQALVQFAMFMTPVFWVPSQIPQRHVLLTLNPFYYLLDAVRTPLLGHDLDPRTWPVLAGLAIAGWIVALLLFASTRRRIVHYL